MTSLVTSFASGVYRVALGAFPSSLRERYGREMLHTFEEALVSRRGLARVRFVIAALADAIRAGVVERRRQAAGGGGTLPLGSAGRDIAHAIRSLTKARAFTLVSVLSLGIGLGTVLMMLLTIRGLVGTPPLVVSDGLVELVIIPQGALRARVNDWAIDTWSYPDFADVRDANTGLTLAGWTPGQVVLRTADGGGGARVDAMYVSASYFGVVGVPLARGPGFSETDTPGQAEAVISHRTWQKRLNAAPDVVGATISINSTPHVVVGVAPEAFRGHFAQHRPGFTVYLPLREHPRLAGRDSLRANRDTDWVQILGRLAPDRSRAEADAVVSSIMSAAQTRYPASNGLKSASIQDYSGTGARRRRDMRMEAGVVVGAGVMVLLVVCLNMSGMVLVRAATRERELAVRLAVGASRGRLMQYLLAEAVVLAFAGGLLGAMVTFGIPALLSIWAGEPSEVSFAPDAQMAAAGIGLCLAASIVFGLLPAIRFSRPNVITALKDDAGGGGRRVGRVHRWTAAIQAGLAVPFIIVGGVQLNQFRLTANAELGFETEGLYALPVDLSSAARDDADPQLMLRSITSDVARAAGVASVAAANGLPLDNDLRRVRVTVAGGTAAAYAQTTRVSPEYLGLLGAPLIRGRGITSDDRPGAEPVVLITQALASRLFPAGEPVGERITFALGSSAGPVDPRWPQQHVASTDQTFTVVGVTADLADAYLGGMEPQLFVPLAQHPVPHVYVVARGAAGAAPQAITAAYQAALSAFYRDPDVLAAGVTTGERLVRRSRSELMMLSMLSMIGAGAALLLAALGIFGVIGFMVATRTREIGIRIALGASQPRVLAGVLRDAVRLAAGGIAGGLGLGYLWVNEISWTGVGPIEALAFAAAAMTAFGVTVAAALPAARRAAAVEPLIAMRAE